MTGLTLTFSDVYNTGDVVEIGGQIGRIEQIGLRFTTLVNFHNQKVFIPNRNIGSVARFRSGAVRAYTDIEIPPGADEEKIKEVANGVAGGICAQFAAAMVTEPELFGVYEAKGGNWKFLRLRLRLWPGQTAVVESTFRNRLLAALKKLHPDYAEWMFSVIYRI